MREMRPAGAKDREFARAVHHAAYRDVVQRQFGRWDEDQQNTFFEGDWDGRENSILLVDGRYCGYCCIEHRDEDVHVRELVIHPDFQGRGVGTGVLTSVMDVAAQRSMPVVLGALRENRARVLYERLGFVPYGETDTHVLMRWVP